MMASRSLQALERLPLELRARRWIGLATAPDEAVSVPEGAEPSLPLGIDCVDSLLPGGGLPRGAVVELCLRGGLALGTTLALRACRSAQRAGGGRAWCGFIDPSGTLHAPGVASRGVDLDRLIVVRPSPAELSRVALRMAEARAFALLVVDTAGTVDRPLDVHLGPWVRVVRRLGLALQGTESTVLLLTDSSARRSVALPVAQRLELHRKSERELSLAITRDAQGRLTPPRSVAVWHLLGELGPGLRSSKPLRRMAGAA